MDRKQKVNSNEPLTLDDLEVKILSREQIKRNRAVKVIDPNWIKGFDAVKVAIQNRFERRLSVAVIAIVTLMLFIGVIFPDRYESASESVKLFLAATSGFFAAKAMRIGN